MILCFHEMVPDGDICIRTEEQGIEREGICLLVSGEALLLQAVASTHHVFELVEAEVRHDLTQVFCDETHVVHHILGLACEAFPELLILRADAEGAGILVADTEHLAADRDERAGAEAEELCAQEAGDGRIPTGQEFAVCFELHAVAELIQEEDLLRFGKSQLPRKSRMAHAGPRRCPCAAVAAADGDAVGLRLDDAGCNGADTRTGGELHVDLRLIIGILQVKDELCQVFDGVDIMVRRRRNQSDARGGVACLANGRIDLAARKVSAFARLGALRALDLDFLPVDEVIPRDTEACCRYLLDLIIDRRAVRERRETLGVLAAFPGVAAAAESVHGFRDALMGFLAECAIAHRASTEMMHDGVHTLDLFDRDAASGGIIEFQKVTKTDERLIDRLREFLVDRIASRAACPLQKADGLRRQDVWLVAVSMVHVDIAGREPLGPLIRRLVAHLGFLGDLLQADAADRRGDAAEIFLRHFLADADSFEDLRAVVALDRGDPHLTHDPQDAVHCCREVVCECFLRTLAVQAVLVREILHRFQRQIRMDRRHAETDQRGEMMDLTRFARLQNDADIRTYLLADEVVVQPRRSKERRDRHVLLIHAAVREDQDILPIPHRSERRLEKVMERLLHRAAAAGCRIEQRKHDRLQLAAFQMLDDLHFLIRDERTVDEERRRPLLIRIHDIGHIADHDRGRSHDLFTDTVDRRIRDLCEILLEIVIEQLRRFRQDSERRIHPHRTDRLFAVLRHRRQDIAQILDRIAEIFLLEKKILRHCRLLLLLHQILQVKQMLLAPLRIRMRLRHRVLDFLITDDALLRRIDEEELARLEASFVEHILLSDRHRPHFRRQDDTVILHDIVARRTQTIAVQHPADAYPIAETHRRRTVPWLHHEIVVTVECPLLLIHRRILLPRLRHHDHHRMRERMSRHVDVLEAVIKHRRVTPRVIDDRESLHQLRIIRRT